MYGVIQHPTLFFLAYIRFMLRSAGRCAMAAVVIWRFHKDLGVDGDLEEREKKRRGSILQFLMLYFWLHKRKYENSKVEKNENF